MIDRICISINNRCNLRCKYCHFHEKGYIEDVPMDIFAILDNVKKYAKQKFKIGFVGDGEAFLDFDKLKSYIKYIEDSPFISAYTITNGTVDLSDEDWLFLENHKIKVGFSVDGYKDLHNLNRCNSFDKAMMTAEHFKRVTGHYPTWNSTVGKDCLDNADKVIEFFKPFGTRVTFSRMIGKQGIPLEEYRLFLLKAEEAGLEVRRGGNDCTMYGGQCGAGINNYFFANGKVYFCGNCIDLSPVANSDITFEELEKMASNIEFNRKHCYKETFVSRQY